jgi:class 3 adenylate cyclase/CHASE2 domain-containing sensor protein
MSSENKVSKKVEKKGLKKVVIQISIGVLIAGVIVLLSWVSKNTKLFPFYEILSLKIFDQQFVIRGSIPLHSAVGTVDIDAQTLEKEGRFQDWTRDKYGEVVTALKDLNARMVGFDVFFPEASSAEILKKQDFLKANVKSVNDVANLFRDYDEEFQQAMIDAGNVLIGEAFSPAEKQDPEWVKNNTAEKDEQKAAALAMLKPYYKDYPEWEKSKLPFYVDIEPPISKLIKASKGVGYAMTVADIDGSVRHYPIVLVYDGKLWPSLGLMMILEYIGVKFEDIQIIPGKAVILPPGKLPDGTPVHIRIPINKKGLMIVNWAGDFWDEQFFHVPHISLLINKNRWRDAEIARTLKKLFIEKPELFSTIQSILENPASLKQAIVESGTEWSAPVMETSLWLLLCKDIEQNYISSSTPFPQSLPKHWENLVEYDSFVNVYNEIKTNHHIVRLIQNSPKITLETVADSLNVHPPDKIRLGYFTLKEKFTNGGLKPDDYPLYFFDPEVNGKIMRKEDFKGKVFIYGLTAAGTHDLNPMPYNQRYPMVGLYANIFNTVISNKFIQRVPFLTEALIILALGLLTGIALPRFKPLIGAGIILVLLLGYVASAQYLFEKQGWWIDILGPVIVIIIGYTSVTVYGFFSEEKEKKMIRGMFSRYVTKSVVDELIKNPDMVKLGGEKKVLTVFFSDVAGFTSISEKMTPEELVSHLNEYLTAMSNIVLKYDGMIDKYEGDAIMAVFGTPVKYDDHAVRACYVSLEMQSELMRLREKWRGEGKPELFVRIGLNTGPMVAGNMGAADRLEYTVMGDSVNLGSRLEGANKQYGTYIMISEYTYEAVKDNIIARYLDSIRVKGKLQPVRVYELMGRADDGLNNEMKKVKDLYDKGIENYLARNWQAGLECFNQALVVKLDDSPSSVYVERCTEFLQNPPPDDWDGVFVMKTK